MLSQHVTSGPSWRVLVSILKLVHVLQVKDLYFSLGKEVVMQESRTCHLGDLPIQSQTSCLVAIEAVTPLPFLSFSDVVYHSLLLSKKDVMSWDRTDDLESHSPAWSSRAVEAIGCRDVFGYLDYCSSSSLYLVVAYEALLERIDRGAI